MFNDTLPTIYIDMDGVLADFESKYIELTGLSDFNNINWGALGSRIDNIFALLEPMKDAEYLVSEAFQLAKVYNYKVEILTAIPSRRRISLAAQHKREWISRYFPILKDVVNFGPYAIDKQNWCSNKYDVLIDDSVINISQWKGIGIFHKSAEESISCLGKNLYINSLKSNL